MIPARLSSDCISASAFSILSLRRNFLNSFIVSPASCDAFLNDLRQEIPLALAGGLNWRKVRI